MNECREKWKNLRSVFVRHLKFESNKKPYYLSDAMKFTLPFIRTGGKRERKFPEISDEPQSAHTISELSSDGSVQNTYNYEDEEGTTVADVYFSSHEIPQEDPPQNSVIGSRKRKRNTQTDVEMSLKGLMDAKKESVSEDPQAKKMFLLSLLPEIEPLTGTQMRSFRREVLQLIDHIRGS